MKCIICNQQAVDGAMNETGEYVCVDCWATGEAAVRGMKAISFVPAQFYRYVNYPPDMQQRFLDACNNVHR